MITDAERAINIFNNLVNCNNSKEFTEYLLHIVTNNDKIMLAALIAYSVEAYKTELEVNTFIKQNVINMI
jgi:hypothetical protein